MSRWEGLSRPYIQAPEYQIVPTALGGDTATECNRSTSRKSLLSSFAHLGGKTLPPIGPKPFDGDPHTTALDKSNQQIQQGVR